MILDARSVQLLNMLLRSPAYVSIDALAQSLQVSKRTVYYDIQKINDWLRSQGFPQLQYVRTLGFYVEDSFKKQIVKQLQTLQPVRHYDYSTEERKAWIGLLIFSRNRPIFLRDFFEKLQVSRSTLLNDVKELKSEWQLFQVQLDFHRKQGYFIKGEEIQKRKLIVRHIVTLLERMGYERFCAVLLNGEDVAIRHILLQSESFTD